MSDNKEKDNTLERLICYALIACFFYSIYQLYGMKGVMITLGIIFGTLFLLFCIASWMDGPSIPYSAPASESVLEQQTINEWFAERHTPEHRILKLKDEEKNWEKKANDCEKEAVRLEKLTQKLQKKNTDDSLMKANRCADAAPIYRKNAQICRENVQALRDIAAKIKRGEEPILESERQRQKEFAEQEQQQERERQSARQQAEQERRQAVQKRVDQLESRRKKMVADYEKIKVGMTWSDVFTITGDKMGAGDRGVSWRQWLLSSDERIGFTVEGNSAGTVTKKSVAPALSRPITADAQGKIKTD